MRTELIIHSGQQEDVIRLSVMANALYGLAGQLNLRYFRHRSKCNFCRGFSSLIRFVSKTIPNLKLGPGNGMNTLWPSIATSPDTTDSKMLRKPRGDKVQDKDERKING